MWSSRESSPVPHPFLFLVWPTLLGTQPVALTSFHPLILCSHGCSGHAFSLGLKHYTGSLSSVRSVVVGQGVALKQRSVPSSSVAQQQFLLLTFVFWGSFLVWGGLCLFWLVFLCVCPLLPLTSLQWLSCGLLPVASLYCVTWASSSMSSFLTWSCASSLSQPRAVIAKAVTWTSAATSIEWELGPLLPILDDLVSLLVTSNHSFLVLQSCRLVASQLAPALFPLCASSVESRLHYIFCELTHTCSPGGTGHEDRSVSLTTGSK